jgi:hypothetical protein
MNYRKIYLWVSAIGLLPVGLSYGAFPEQSLSMLFDISVESTNHTHVFRGIMGLYLAMVAFWILGAMREKYERSAIQTEIVFMGGLAAGRVFSILVDGWPNLLLTGFALVEIGLVVAGVILLKQVQSTSQDS